MTKFIGFSTPFKRRKRSSEGVRRIATIADIQALNSAVLTPPMLIAMVDAYLKSPDNILCSPTLRSYLESNIKLGSDNTLTNLAC